MRAARDAIFRRKNLVSTSHTVDMLSDGFRQHNSETPYNPHSVNTYRTQQTTDLLVRQSAIFVAPFQ
jgi:hypothetical protein